MLPSGAHAFCADIIVLATSFGNRTNYVAPEPEGSSPHSREPATGPYPEPDESTPPPQPISLRSILVPSSYLRLGLPSGLFSSGVPTKTLYTFLSSHIRVTCPTHLILPDLICLMISGDEYKLWSSPVRNFLHFPVTNILLEALLSNTHSLYSSRDVRDQVSHPYKTTGRIIVLYILTFTFVDSKREDRRLWTEW
jgi:hypothetical protein